MHMYKNVVEKFMLREKRYTLFGNIYSNFFSGWQQENCAYMQDTFNRITYIVILFSIKTDFVTIKTEIFHNEKTKNTASD